MYNQKWLAIAVILFIFTIPIYSEGITDSLLQKIEHTSGKEKLELINQLALSQQDSKEVLKTAELLEKESEEQEDIEFLNKSYVFKVKHYLYVNNIDSIIFYSDLMGELSKKHNLPNFHHYYVSYAYMNMGYYDLAIHTLNLLLKDNEGKGNAKESLSIHHLLGHAYSYTRRYKLAQEHYEKALVLYSKINSEDPILQMGLYNSLIFSLCRNKEYDKALSKCVIFEELLRDGENSIPQNQKIFLSLLLYNRYAEIYISLKDLSRTKQYLDKVDQLSMNGIPEIFKYDVNLPKAKYFYLLGNYNKTIACVDESLTFYKKSNLRGSVYFIDLYLLKIEALKKLGKYEEVIDIQGAIMNYNDSISKENVPLQISELSKGYELEKAKIKEEKDRVKLERTQILVISLGMIVILLIIILYIVKRNAKRLKEKNLILYQRNLNLDEYKVQRSDFNPNNFKKEISLFDRIETYIIESGAFKDPDLIRDDIAAALNTNVKYLTDAIRAETKKAFLDYINQFRLNYVYHQLVTLDESIPINSIMFDAGFSSSSTFYRLFKEKFGMTPNEVRQTKFEMINGVNE